MKDNINFTVNTLQEYDDIEPKGLDIIFEYKAGDKEFQKDESKEVVKNYRMRNFDPKNRVIAKLEMESSAK